MKILYHHRIASKDGQYVHIEEIIKALTDLDHEVVVVCPQMVEQSKFGSDGGWMSTLRSSLPKFCSELLEFSYSFIAFFKLVKNIIQHRPDAIYERYNLFFPAGIWAKKLFNLKLILEVNSPLYDERSLYGGIILDKLALWSEKYVWINADHICPVTKVLAKYLIQAKVKKENITVIANGIDPRKFYPNPLVIKKPEIKDKLIIGFVGFCREWHQLDRILELIAKNEKKDLLLLIVGDGPVSNDLKQLAKKLNIPDKLYITGIVEREEMPNWLDQIDISLQPQVTPWSSPLKLIEYLAKGKAIVAPDTDNIKELLTHNKNALLYNINQPNEVLELITDIINNQDLKHDLQREALKTITEKKLTWQNNAMRIESIFSVLTSNTSEPIKENK